MGSGQDEHAQVPAKARGGNAARWLTLVISLIPQNNPDFSDVLIETQKKETYSRSQIPVLYGGGRTQTQSVLITTDAVILPK